MRKGGKMKLKIEATIMALFLTAILLCLDFVVFKWVLPFFLDQRSSRGLDFVVFITVMTVALHYGLWLFWKLVLREVRGQ